MTGTRTKARLGRNSAGSAHGFLTAAGWAMATLLCGCALSYTDDSGNRHIIGLVDYTVRAPAAAETIAGDVVEVTSIGLSIGQNAQGGYITAGYNRQATAVLRDDVVVLGNPITAL